MEMEEEGRYREGMQKRIQKSVQKEGIYTPVLMTNNANNTVHTLLLDEQRNGRLMCP